MRNYFCSTRKKHLHSLHFHSQLGDQQKYSQKYFQGSTLPWHPPAWALLPHCTLSLSSSKAEIRGLEEERQMEEPRSLRASLELATSLSILWLPVFLSPSLHEEGDSSLGSSALLKRLDNYRGRGRREKALVIQSASPYFLFFLLDQVHGAAQDVLEQSPGRPAAPVPTHQGLFLQKPAVNSNSQCSCPQTCSEKGRSPFAALASQHCLRAPADCSGDSFSLDLLGT